MKEKDPRYWGNYHSPYSYSVVHAMARVSPSKAFVPLCKMETAQSTPLSLPAVHEGSMYDPDSKLVTCKGCKEELNQLGLLVVTLPPFLGLVRKDDSSPMHAIVEIREDGNTHYTTFCGWTSSAQQFFGRDTGGGVICFKPNTSLKDRLRRLQSGSTDACLRCLESMRANGFNVEQPLNGPGEEDIPDEDVFVILWKKDLKDMKIPFGQQPPSVFRTQKELEAFIATTIDPNLDGAFMNGMISPDLIERIIRTAITEDFELVPKTLGLKSKEGDIP